MHIEHMRFGIQLVASVLASIMVFGSGLSACQMLRVLGVDSHHHADANTRCIDLHEEHSCCDHHHAPEETACDDTAEVASPERAPCSGECQLDPDTNLTLALQQEAARPSWTALPRWQQPPGTCTSPPPKREQARPPDPVNTGPPVPWPALSGCYKL